MILASLERTTRAVLSRGGERLASVDWRRETIYPLTAAMEVAWFAPWYTALIPATGRLPPTRTAIGLFVVMVIPVYVVRLLDRLYLKPKIQQAVLAALLALTCVLTLRVFLYAGQDYKRLGWLAETIKDVVNVYELVPDWLVIVSSVLFLWWRGISLGQRRPSVDAVVFSFYVGVVSFIGFALIVDVVTDQDPSVFIPVFFFCSLMALAASRMEEMRGLRGALRSPFGFSWLFAISLAAFAVILLGALLGALLTGHNMLAIVHWIEPLLLLVGVVLGLFLVLLRTVVNWILGFLRALGIERNSESLTELLDRLENLMPYTSDEALKAPSAVGAAAVIIRFVLMLGLVVGLGALVIWMLRSSSRPDRERDQGEHEFMLSTALVLENLRQLVDAGRGRLSAALGLVGRSGLRGLFRALTIRRIYAHMLQLAALQGYSRAASQTPYEFEQTAARAFPDATAEIHVITEAYVAVHYGEVPESDAELQVIRACWERLKESVHAKKDRP